MLLGKFKAYSLLVFYLEERLFKLKNNLNGKIVPLNSTEKIPWPFSNTDWVEFVYALSAAGIKKQNDLSIIKLSNKLQEVFDVNPSDKIYKTILHADIFFCYFIKQFNYMALERWHPILFLAKLYYVNIMGS